MENDADGKKPPTDGEKTAGPGVIEFYKIVGEELEGELQALQARVKKVEAIAPGSPKHIKLLQLYVDKLDEKIQKGVEANMEISARTLKHLGPPILSMNSSSVSLKILTRFSGAAS